MLSTTRPARSASRTMVRSIGLCAVLLLPALVVRLGGWHPTPVVALLLYGAAVVAASFLLAWAAEAAQVDISGGLAIAVLALIAVLPEYAVDLYYAYTAGHDPTYVQYAAANMTGSNRLLLGLGWPVVTLLALAAAKRLRRGSGRALKLDRANRMELGFLLIAGVIAFAIPLTGQIHLLLGLVLLAWFAFYLWRLSHGTVEEPELIGTPAALGGLAQRTRRVTVTVLFVAATAVILLCAEPFANSLIQAGTELGVDQFLLVQWLAPLSSEAPELIIAVLFALRGKGTAAIAILISSKVNQWTLLVGSLPLAYLAGGGGTALVLDGRQTEEMLLTAAQTMMGVAVLLALRFPRWAAWTLLALFLVQFPLTDTHGRLVLAGIYLVLAAAALVWHRQMIIPTLLAPFRPSTSSQSTSEQAPGPGRITSRSGPASEGAVPTTSSLRSQPGTSGQVLTPRGSQDLRGQPITELHYPRNSIVVLAGIPGAGKSTLLHRLFGTTGAETQPIRNPDGVLVLDSEQARNHFRRRLQRLPYPLWRPLAHLFHYARIRTALRSGAPLVVHDCGTRFWVPWLLRRWSVRHHVELHLILLDVAPAIARAAQHQRHRLVRATTFGAHCRSWRRRTATDPAGLIPGAISAVVLDRTTAQQLQAIHLHPATPRTRTPSH